MGCRTWGEVLDGQKSYVVMTRIPLLEEFEYEMLSCMRPYMGSYYLRLEPEGSPSQDPYTVLFRDTFDVSGPNNDVSFERERRQTGSLSPLTYLDTSDEYTQVGSAQVPGRLRLRANNTIVAVSPNHNFNEWSRFAIQFEVDAGVDDVAGTSSDWCGIVFGTSTQNPAEEESDGMSVLFCNNGLIKVYDGSVEVFRGNGGYPGGIPRSNLQVRIEGEVENFAGSPATLRLFINGRQVALGSPGWEYVKTAGFRGNFITLLGAAFEGRAWAHTFDNLVVSGTDCIGISTDVLNPQIGQIIPGINVYIPRGLNLSQPVLVTIRSSNPSVAVPVGADSNGVLVVRFPAGGSNMQTVSIAGLRLGNATISLAGPVGVHVSNSVEVAVAPLPCRLAVAVEPAGAGTVGVDPLPGADGTYAAGTVVTLSARPEAGFSFATWAGGLAGSTNPLVITLESNVEARAHFTLWTMKEELLFADTFDVSARSNSVSFENPLRQSGSLGILTYQDTSDEPSQVGNADAPAGFGCGRPTLSWPCRPTTTSPSSLTARLSSTSMRAWTIPAASMRTGPRS